MACGMKKPRSEQSVSTDILSYSQTGTVKSLGCHTATIAEHHLPESMDHVLNATSGKKQMKDHEPDEIISYIAGIRQSNNRLWVDILRLAFRHAPKDARKIMKKITKNDKEISKWTSRL